MNSLIIIWYVNIFKLSIFVLLWLLLTFSASLSVCGKFSYHLSVVIVSIHSNTINVSFFCMLIVINEWVDFFFEYSLWQYFILVLALAVSNACRWSRSELNKRKFFVTNIKNTKPTRTWNVIFISSSLNL